jgi:hypothetical protein
LQIFRAQRDVIFFGQQAQEALLHARRMDANAARGNPALRPLLLDARQMPTMTSASLRVADEEHRVDVDLFCIHDFALSGVALNFEFTQVTMA